jgi:hypothetical protein
MKTGELSGGHFARQTENVHSCSHGIRKKRELLAVVSDSNRRFRFSRELKTP